MSVAIYYHRGNIFRLQRFMCVCMQLRIRLPIVLLRQWSLYLQVSTISGGISNALYKVEDTTRCIKIVVRVYGDNTEKFVDRKEEVGMMELLHNKGFGPQVLGTFANGRIESFLELTCLQPNDISKPLVIKSIAKTLAEFHLVSKTWEAPETAMTPFERTKEWLLTSKSMDFSGCKKSNDLYNSLRVDRMLEEVDIVANASKCFESPVVLCHNDLLSGNIMVERDGDLIRQMTFIDFEYADWAPRGFDLGNHFCEYAGFEGDYSKYPTDPSMFVREYLCAYQGRQPSQSQIEQVVKEANVFALAAHLYWAAWSILQAKWSSIDFDYMEYASVRLHEYYKRKDEFLN